MSKWKLAFFLWRLPSIVIQMLASWSRVVSCGCLLAFSKIQVFSFILIWFWMWLPIHWGWQEGMLVVWSQHPCPWWPSAEWSERKRVKVSVMQCYSVEVTWILFFFFKCVHLTMYWTFLAGCGSFTGSFVEYCTAELSKYFWLWNFTVLSDPRFNIFYNVVSWIEHHLMLIGFCFVYN